LYFNYFYNINRPIYNCFCINKSSINSIIDHDNNLGNSNRINSYNYVNNEINNECNNRKIDLNKKGKSLCCLFLLKLAGNGYYSIGLNIKNPRASMMK